MRARTGAFETEYLLAGSGPWLVLAHSLGANLHMWRHQMDALARRFHVVAYDSRGHGQSGCPPVEYNVADLADDLVRLMDELGIERASVAGLSMGGMMGQCLAAGHPDRVDKLLLADTTSYYEGESVAIWHQRAATAREQGMEALADATMERWFTPEFRQREPDEVARTREAFVATKPDGYALAAGALSRFDVRPRLSSISAATLVVCGEADPATPPELGRAIAASIPNAQFELIPSAAHLSCLEQPERFNQLLLEFL